MKLEGVKLHGQPFTSGPSPQRMVKTMFISPRYKPVISDGRVENALTTIPKQDADIERLNTLLKAFQGPSIDKCPATEPGLPAWYAVYLGT